MARKLKIEKKKRTFHSMTSGTMQGCGLTFMVVCINGKTQDTREGNVTIRSEVPPKNICSLEFHDIRE